MQSYASNLTAQNNRFACPTLKTLTVDDVRFEKEKKSFTEVFRELKQRTSSNESKWYKINRPEHKAISVIINLNATKNNFKPSE